MDLVDVVGVLRAQAWERAKGEMRSMLHTFFQQQKTFDEFDLALSQFIAQIEDNGWHE